MFDNRPPAPWRDEPTPWRDPAIEQTPPVLAVTPPAPPAKTKRGPGGLAFLLIGALVGGLVGIGGARSITPQLFPTGVGGTPASTSTLTSTSPADAATAADIKGVLTQANQAQAQAFAKNDPTLMRATSTDNHYAEMVQINADLASGGIIRIELLNTTFGNIAVNGSTATATTTETWRTTMSNGSVISSTDQNDYVLLVASGVWRVESNTQPGNTGVTAPTQPQGPTSTTVRSTSRNWSGYVATGGTYTSVSGTWVIAKPDPKTPGIDATWVGIGGADTTDLIQAGTEATVNPDGTVGYDAWTETLPQSTRTVTLTVNGGDTVTVTLTERSSGSWLIEMKNVTTNKSYTTTLGYNSSKSSAEWIQEAPSLGRGIAPLDSFGSVRFSAASTVLNGKKQTLKGAGASAVIMTNSSNQALAVPTAIGTDGSSFNVDRTSAPSTGGGTGSPGRRRG